HRPGLRIDVDSRDGWQHTPKRRQRVVPIALSIAAGRVEYERNIFLCGQHGWDDRAIFIQREHDDAVARSWIRRWRPDAVVLHGGRVQFDEPEPDLWRGWPEQSHDSTVRLLRRGVFIGSESRHARLWPLRLRRRRGDGRFADAKHGDDFRRGSSGSALLPALVAD